MAGILFISKHPYLNSNKSEIQKTLSAYKNCIKDEKETLDKNKIAVL
jgi:hypothetical protein